MPETAKPPTVWSDAVAPGGEVCAVPVPGLPDGICGTPTESEPCPEHTETAPEATCGGCDVCATTPCAGGCKAFTGELGQPMHICADEQACWDAFGKAAVQP